MSLYIIHLSYMFSLIGKKHLYNIYICDGVKEEILRLSAL